VENAMVAYAKEQTRRDSLAQAATTSQNSLNWPGGSTPAA